MLGTILAAFTHHTIVESTMPWRLVTMLAASQFGALYPLARRRYTALTTMVFTLGMQGVLHLATSCVDGAAPGGMLANVVHAGRMVRGRRTGTPGITPPC